MLNSKLIQIFKSFSKMQLRQVQRFVDSPSHNEHESVGKLFSYLRNLDDVNSDTLAKVKLYEAACPGQLYDEKRLRHVCSYLLSTLQDYLVFKALEEDQPMKNVLLLKQLRNRHLDKSFDSNYNKLKVQQVKSANRNDQWHYHNYQIEQELYNATTGRKVDTQQVLESMSVELDHFYISAKLRHACNILSHRKVFKTEFGIGLLDEIVNHVQEHDLDEIPAIGIYYHTYLTISEESTESFDKLRTLINEHEFNFPQPEMRDIYLFAINFCIRRINQGQPEYMRKVFELYRRSLDNKILLDNNKLSPWTYKNVNFAALKLNELEWAEHFTTSFKEYVDHEYQEAMHQYNLAKIKFAKGSYKEATKILHRLEIKDLFTNLDAKLTLIKSSYLLDDHDRVEYLLNSLKQLLKRRGLMTYHKQSYSTFIKFVSKLMKLNSLSYTDPAVKALQVQINETEKLPERDWLLNQLHALK